MLSNAIGVVAFQLKTISEDAFYFSGENSGGAKLNFLR